MVENVSKSESYSSPNHHLTAESFLIVISFDHVNNLTRIRSNHVNHASDAPGSSDQHVGHKHLSDHVDQVRRPPDLSRGPFGPL